MYLADMGAEVIKVEPPRGDDARSWGPPFLGDEAAWFLSANRNKRSICLDLTSETGIGILFRLLADADVFVENLNPAKLGARGLDPQTVTDRFPRLIYCALSGFGLTGPESGRPGYDLIAQARSGLMSVTGAADSTPQRVSTALSDIAAGTVAAYAVAAALYRQQRTGRGDVVDVSLLESDLAFMAPRLASYLAGDAEPQPSGGTDSVLAVYQSFETADQPIVVAVGNDRMWQRFCATAGLDGMGSDERYATNALRRGRRQEIIPAVRERMLTRTSAEWLEALAAAEVPCAPVHYLSRVVTDPQVVERGAIIEIEHPTAGWVQVVRQPWLLESQRDVKPTAPPILGADTVDVLREVGYTTDAIEALLEGGVAWTAPATSS
jgi:crotonobetainyl-CoA:carnitine CoA-transferase CaiB-like acyl-CoA transferase